jgi:ATP synthase protein I
MSVQSPLSRKPYVAVLKWQALVTGGLAVVAGLWAGGHGALSALLGGLVNISAGIVYAVVVLAARPSTAGRTVTTLFRAEGSKILVILLQLWFLLATYKDVVLPAFLAAFVITVLLSSMALLVRD